MFEFVRYRIRQKAAAVVFIVPVLLLVMLVAGCGNDNSAEGAVRKYFSAWENGNWEEFKKAVVPQELTKDEETLAKEKFAQVQVKVEGLSLKATISEEDASKATVVLTGGKLSYTAIILGEKKTESVDITSQPEEDRTYNVVKKDGTWYVDTLLG